MSSKGLLLALVALAIVGVGVLMVASGDDLFGGGSGSGDTRGSGEDQMDLAGTDADGSEAPGGPRSPVLFGRASARIGSGDALGRLADFQTKKPVGGATVRIRGIGYADEDVAVSGESGKDGHFHLADVAAGEDYVLDVIQVGTVVRTVRGIAIAADKIEDLGTIWLGDAGTLEGRVMTIGGAGIAGAEVTVLPALLSMEAMMQDIVGFISKLDRDPEPIAKGKTGADGRFAIDAIPPGPITVIARADGYNQDLLRVVMSRDGAVGANPEFRLDVAEPITGRVIDEEGRGIGGARIAFMDQNDDENGFYARRFIETESDGTFEVSSPPVAGKLIAIVAAERFPTLFTEVEGRREGLEFTLVGGALLTIRFVSDESGEPLPDASIVAMVMEGANMSNNSGTFLTGVTDPDGRVEFIARPGFVMMLFFEHPVEGLSMYSPQLGGGGGGFALKGPARIDLKRGKNEAELRKPAGVLVSGTVTNPDGRPVPGATVSYSGGYFGAAAKAVTDQDGLYHLMVPKMPMIGIQATAPGHVQDPESAAVTIGESPQLKHDIRLLFAATVEGKVVGPKGGPAAGLEVRLNVESGEGNDVIVDWTGSVPTATTDSAGRFVLEDVAPGQSYRLLARGAGYVVTRSEVFEIGGTVRHAKAPRLTMKTGVSVDVLVIGPSGREVDGARVDVHIEQKEEAYWSQRERWRSFARLATSATGRATAKDLPDGKVTFTARKDGFAAARGSALVEAGGLDVPTVEIRLRPEVLVSGMVRDQHGNAVKDARVNVMGQTSVNTNAPDADAEWVPSTSASTDTYGRFEVPGVPANVRISLWVNCEGHQSRTFPVDGPTDSLELTITKIDPDVQKRVAALRAELMDVYQRMQAAKDDTERQELAKQIQALNLEIQSLEGNGSSDVVRAVPEGG